MPRRTILWAALRGALAAAWAARWRPWLIPRAVLAGWRTRGLIRPYSGRVCEACAPAIAQASEKLWSEAEGRWVHLCAGHLAQFQLVNANRGTARAFQRGRRRRTT